MARQTLTSVHNPASSGSTGATRGFAPLDLEAVEPTIGLNLRQAREEVDDAFKDMEMFHQMEPDEIMRRAGGHSARLSYIRVRVMRVEDYQRQWKDVRIRELEPALTALEQQFTIASRLHSVRELDYKMEAGER